MPKKIAKSRTSKVTTLGQHRKELAAKKQAALDSDIAEALSTQRVPYQNIAKLLAMLLAHRFDPDNVELIPTEGWADVAKCAAVNPPSETTIKQICALLRKSKGT